MFSRNQSLEGLHAVPKDCQLLNIEALFLRNPFHQARDKREVSKAQNSPVLPQECSCTLDYIREAGISNPCGINKLTVSEFLSVIIAKE